ncbi:MAG TPA: GNAT family N-acetyltransferase [Xanthobacteraceae bacterium]
MGNVQVRPAIDADHDRLIEAVIDQQEYERKLHDSRRPGAEMAASYLDHVRERTARNDGAIFIAEFDGAFAGYAACWVEHECNVAETEDSNRFGYIADTYVIPRLRGRGMVASLLQAAEEHLGTMGVGRIRIGALAGNASALRAYAKHGFEAYEVVMEKRARA